MNRVATLRAVWLSAVLVGVLAQPGQAQIQLLQNGGFEDGLAGWTTASQLGSEGGFFVQSGTESPVNALPVPAPPGGTQAAMTDAQGPGSHVLYQDFVVPVVVPGGFVRFSLFRNNLADDFYGPDNLDFATPVLNQQARADILMATSDPFSVAPEDVLQNLFRTNPGDPLLSGYNQYQVDISSLLQTYAGQTLRLRFAQVDNVFIMNLGLDDVGVVVIPEAPAGVLAGYAALACGAVLGLGRFRRRA